MPGKSDSNDGNGALPVPASEDLPVRVRDYAEGGGRWLMTRLARRLPVDEQLHETVSAACHDRWSCVVNPPKHAEDDVLDAGERLVRSLHGEIEQLSIEIHKTSEDGIEFHFVAVDREDADRMQQLVLSEYPHAEADIERSRLPIKQGDLCRIDRVELAEDHLLPLRHANSADAPSHDPLGGVLDTLTDSTDGRCVFQTVVEPTGADWTTRYSRGTPLRREDHRWWRLPPDRVSRWDAIPEAVALSLFVVGGWWAVSRWFAGLTPGIEPLFAGLGLVCVGYWWATMFGHPRSPSRQTSEDVAEDIRESPCSRGERRMADNVVQQAHEPAFRVSQRLITFGRRESHVDTLRERVGSQLRSSWHHPHSGQELTLRPLRNVPSAIEQAAARSPISRPVKHALDRALSRSRRRTPRRSGPVELSSTVGHLADSSSVSKGGIDWAAPRLREQVPPSAPRYQRPGWNEEEAAAAHSSLARAGQLMLDRLPRALADRLAERGVGIERRDDGVPLATLPEWVTSESALDIDVDHRETARHKRYGEVELQLIKEGDTTTHEDDGDVWMGSFLREIVESKQQRPRDDLLIGYQERGGTMREVSVPFDTLFTHVFVQGLTGSGKSTLAGVILAQWAHAGYGFAVPDPSGELVSDILRWLPGHRHEDVVYYAPEPDVAEKIVGLNPLSIPQEPGDDDFGRAVDLAVDEVENGLRTKEGQWGARMIGICRNLARVMISASEEFTLIDFHDAIATERGREELADRAGKSDQWVAKYTRKIAALDDDDLDSLLRRLNEWVESTVSRTTVAIKDSTLDLEEIVQEDKILLFDNKLSNGALSRMLATVVWSRIWNICRRRPESERKPFCVLADEFDDYVTPNMDVDVQVRNARKYKLSLILMTQYLEAIGHKDIQEALDEECKTEITLRLKGESAPRVANRIGLDDPEYLTKLKRFHALVELEIGGDPKGPFEISLPAPMAPERTAEQAHEQIVEPSLDRHGRAPLTDEEIHAQQVLGSEERDRFTTTDEDGRVIEDDPLELTDERKREIVRAIHDEAVVRRGSSDGVRLDHAAERIRQYHDRGDELADQSLSTILNRLPTGSDGLIDRREDNDGNIWVRCTATGRTLIFDTGRSGSSGGAGHDQLLRDAYEPLLKLGLRPTIALQDGDQRADGSLSVEWDGVDGVDWGGLSASRRRALAQELTEENPALAGLVLGREAPLSGADAPKLGARDLTLALEAEKSTGSSKGGYTCRNVCKAANAGLRAVLLCRPDTAPSIERSLTDPPFASSRYADEGEVCYYNLDNLVIKGETMLRPTVPDGEGRDRSVWIHDKKTGEQILEDGSGEELARFDSLKEIYDGPLAYPRACDSDLDETPPGTSPVKEPLNPHEHTERGEWPDPDTWEIVIVPPDAAEPEDLSLYRHGEEIPLAGIADHTEEQAAHDRQNEIMNDLLEEFDRR